LSESIALFHEVADSRGLAEAIDGAAAVWFKRGEFEAGARMLGAARALGGMEALSDTAATARESMGERKFDKAHSEGSRWSADEAVAFAKENLNSALS
jgi:hypothetical protein